MPLESTYAVEILQKSGVEVLPEQQVQLEHYAVLLDEWNSRVNLISRKDTAELWRNHILHSLAGLTVLDIPDGTRVVDVGTGGGLPGIPLAILRPDTQFDLVDSIAKKMRAVSDMAEGIGLQNVASYTDRMEEFAARHPRRYDIVVTRAVARLEKLMSWCLPMMKPGGKLIAWKGGDLQDEMSEARRVVPNAAIKRHDFALKGEEYFRSEGKCLIEVRL